MADGFDKFVIITISFVECPTMYMYPLQKLSTFNILTTINQLLGLETHVHNMYTYDVIKLHTMTKAHYI